MAGVRSSSPHLDKEGVMKKIKSGFNKKGLCKLCKEPRTERGQDPCIANLPGVLFACCGHGVSRGYIKFEDGRTLRFRPEEMDLETPTHWVARRPIPVFITGDTNVILKYKNGKTKTEPGEYTLGDGDRRKIIPPIKED